jgi:hypothetical protein
MRNANARRLQLIYWGLGCFQVAQEPTKGLPVCRRLLPLAKIADVALIPNLAAHGSAVDVSVVDAGRGTRRPLSEIVPRQRPCSFIIDPIAADCSGAPQFMSGEAIISTGKPAADIRRSDEAAIFARELAIRVMRASLISQPRGSLSERADLTSAKYPFSGSPSFTSIPPSHNHEIER